MRGLKGSTFATVAAVALSSCSAASPPPRPGGAIAPAGLAAPPAGYVLSWSDEFDRPGLPDPTKWRYDVSRNREGWWNDEAQYYSAARLENSRIEDGVLIIEARREDFGSAKPADHGGQKYSSARLVTAGKAAWTYGMIDVRAKLPCGRGVWPAIWMLPEGPGAQWPNGGEIDIMEHVGHDEGRVHATIHTGAYGHATGNNRNASVIVPDACTAFHNYQLLWTKDALTIGIDGKPHFHFANDGRGDHATWPFDRPFHLLLNIAVGGTWGGQQGIDDAVFPVRMEVDYVRVYQPR